MKNEGFMLQPGHSLEREKVLDQDGTRVWELREKDPEGNLTGRMTTAVEREAFLNRMRAKLRRIATESVENLKGNDLPPEPDQGRRTFVKAGAAAGGLMATGMIAKKTLVTDEMAAVSLEVPEHHSSEVVIPEQQEIQSLTYEEQIEKYGKIVNVEGVIRAHQEKHYAELLDIGVEESKKKGRARKIIENIKALHLDREQFTKPFSEKGFPKILPYLIGAQESDFVLTAESNKDSSLPNRAIGVLGIKAIAAEDVGYTHEQARDPYLASEISAAFLQKNMERYLKTDDLLLGLCSYNSGWRLEEFSDLNIPQEGMSRRNFYVYLGDRINDKLALGEDVSRELEVLRYVPEILAKKQALEGLGFMEELGGDFVVSAEGLGLSQNWG